MNDRLRHGYNQNKSLLDCLAGDEVGTDGISDGHNKARRFTPIIITVKDRVQDQ